ncbi:HlyD family efflux transporter periplasmic adaptor subunit [Variovorax saccharolyticus]|uniref:HlyD family efflux transporter periplasmic adaptor subunit n=1 Tax=Variovorax saccharolyticus TaxID=3053516 RepID=UPI0025758CE7|nr:HlyD family efflux transporter periplasmic adaptor subunit [Variovorax sp. J31P216]MDM0029170.1 HlyD family efflux transporter periplasmic adaptor subunit [Variovorax sp. J31P216]
MTILTSDLFRPEAIAHRRGRVYGDVIISASPFSTASIAMVSAVAFGLMTWAMTAEYSRTETVAGIITTTRPTTKVFAQRSGILKDLRVQEGQLVQSGDVIAVVSVDVKSEDGKFMGTGGLEEIGRQRLLIEGEVANGERVLNEEKDRLALLIQQSAMEGRSLDSQADVQRGLLESAKKVFDLFGSVIADGIVSKNDYEARHRDVLQAQQRMHQLEQERIKTRGQRAQYKAQLLKAETDYLRQTNEVSLKLSLLEQQRIKGQAEVDYRILAPMTGRVSALQVANGRVVDTRLPALSIVPTDIEFQAEVYAPSRSVGFVREGQPVRLMFDAFPYQRFGSFGATVKTVSHSISGPADLDVPFKVEEPVYRVLLALTRQDAHTQNASFPLQSGMTLQANLILEKRSFVDWLLAPLNAVRKRTA